LTLPGILLAYYLLTKIGSPRAAERGNLKKTEVKTTRMRAKTAVAAVRTVMTALESLEDIRSLTRFPLNDNPISQISQDIRAGLQARLNISDQAWGEAWGED